MKLSLVIPCYNEAKSLPALAARCAEVAAAEPNCEIILVDNGSTDDSPAVMARELTDKPGVRSLRVEVNTGYGAGILAGLAAAEGDILAWTHADLQTDPMDAVTGFGLFKAATAPDLVFVKGQRYGRPASDVAFTQGMSLFETLLMGRPLRDINAQPTMFPRSFHATWKNPPPDFSLDLFAYASAKTAGLKVKRFPVLFAPRLHGVSSWNVDWASKKKFIKRTLDYSFKLKRAFADQRRAD